MNELEQADPNKNAVRTYVALLQAALRRLSSEAKAESSRRYFPPGIRCIGATAGDIQNVARDFHAQYQALSAQEVLSITEQLLRDSECNEDTLLAFAILNKHVKKSFDERLLLRFEYWLEHYVDNWSQVDDLCIKTLYQFLLARPHLIERIQPWSRSSVSWCRRASNVAWVKFIKRKIGPSLYYLDTRLVFENCDLLISDPDEFVQKSIGWLLKVTAAEHEQQVLAYLQSRHAAMPRATLRYAIEKMPASTRAQIMALGRG